MPIPGRGLDREGRLDGDVAGLALIGVAIGNETEHPCGVLEAAALVAAEIVAHGAAFDVDVVPALAEAIASAPCGRHRRSCKRLATMLSSSGWMRHSCNSQAGRLPLMTCAA